MNESPVATAGWTLCSRRVPWRSPPEVRGSMNVLCQMKGASALTSAVPRSFGPR